MLYSETPHSTTCDAVQAGSSRFAVLSKVLAFSENDRSDLWAAAVVSPTASFIC